VGKKLLQCSELQVKGFWLPYQPREYLIATYFLATYSGGSSEPRRPEASAPLQYLYGLDPSFRGQETIKVDFFKCFLRALWAMPEILSYLPKAFPIFNPG
jgi:hypothetical protein